MIVTYNQALELHENLLNPHQRLVLVGGCFDLLHIGHIHFLQRAKEQGDILIVLLESDIAIKKKKGPHRPIHSQKDRATILSSLRMVDHVILLPEHTTDQNYLDVTKLLKPAIIATTKEDPHRKEKEYCAEVVKAKVVDVIDREKDASTTRLAQLLEQEL